MHWRDEWMTFWTFNKNFHEVTKGNTGYFCLEQSTELCKTGGPTTSLGKPYYEPETILRLKKRE